jgi:arsenate reductase
VTRVFNVLFLCIANSARSVMAEGILRKDGAGRFQAFSAGSHPRGTVNPLAISTLQAFGYPSEGYGSKSWDTFAAPGAPAMDFVFTVCDDAAGEACPVWIGRPATAHWGIPDPAAVTESDIERQRAFAEAFGLLRNRIARFLALPMDDLDAIALAERLKAIGRMDGASTAAKV